MWMAGYAPRKKPPEGTRQELFAKALAVEAALFANPRPLRRPLHCALEKIEIVAHRRFGWSCFQCVSVGGTGSLPARESVEVSHGRTSRRWHPTCVQARTLRIYTPRATAWR